MDKFNFEYLLLYRENIDEIRLELYVPRAFLINKATINLVCTALILISNNVFEIDRFLQHQN